MPALNIDPWDCETILLSLRRYSISEGAGWSKRDAELVHQQRALKISRHPASDKDFCLVLEVADTGPFFPEDQTSAIVRLLREKAT
jgi:hypothetical protein